MSTASKLSESVETAFKAFDARFEAWARTVQPDGDTSALRAVAFLWFSLGNDFAVNQTFRNLHDFETSMREKLLNESERFALGVDR